METQILELDGPAISQNLDALCGIVIDSVAAGAAISFMAPLTHSEAARFWCETVQPDVIATRRILIGARVSDRIVGTVQVITDTPPNQPHRCEIAKMMVHPSTRRVGIGRALMHHAITRARALGKSLITLDTRTGDVAAPLYASVGFQVAGVIPDFAWDPDGKAKHATTYMYRQI